jgi:sugar lactone lactonase YvrE
MLVLLSGAIHLSGQTPQLIPYQTTLLAGSGSSSTSFAKGNICPASGNTMTDAHGDGCLATEVVLSSPKYITADTSGNTYFSDTGNGLIRRIDASTKVITTVAGGGTLAKPSSSSNDTGVSCPSGSGVATDFQGDGCLGTEVQLISPTGVAISPLSGDVYFADSGTYTVRRIDHSTGIVYNVAGYVSGTKPTYGYYVNNAGNNYIAATQSALDAPYGIHFDTTGNLYIAEEYKNAVLVVNPTSAATTVAGISIPAGTIAKIEGFNGSSYGAYCPVGVSGTTGCVHGTWTSGSSAATSNNYAPYDVTTDAAGNVYFANEYLPAVGQITTAGIINTYAGLQSSPSTSNPITNKRALANTVQFGSNFGIAADADGNIYIPDSIKGWIWRVDATSQAMWVFAGAGTVCSGGDAYGDGCPASQTVFPNGTLKPSTTAPTYASTPGISGIFVTTNGTLLLADTAANLLHKISLNTNFGTILPTNPVQTIQVHFPAGDGLSSDVLTTNTANFSLATPACTTNSDSTVDCLIEVTATPQAEGAFSSNLKVTSNNGKTGNFTLSGTLELDQKASTTQVTLSARTSNPVTPITITATVTNSYSSPNSGTVEFYASNGTTTTDLGPATLNSNGSASISETFATGDSYTIWATYDGNLYLFPSTSSPVSFQSVIPTFNITPTQNSTSVAQGQIAQNAYTITTIGSYAGTLTFSCSGLPANVSCSFSPSTLSVGSSSYSTETLNIVTTGSLSANHAPDNRGMKATALALLLPGGAVLLFGLRRKKNAAWMLALTMLAVLIPALTGCQTNQIKAAVTPSGTYTVTVTATGTPNIVTPSANIVKTAQFTLAVTKY